MLNFWLFCFSRFSFHWVTHQKKTSHCCFGSTELPLHCCKYPVQGESQGTTEQQLGSICWRCWLHRWTLYHPCQYVSAAAGLAPVCLRLPLGFAFSWFFKMFNRATCPGTEFSPQLDTVVNKECFLACTSFTVAVCINIWLSEYLIDFLNHLQIMYKYSVALDTHTLTHCITDFYLSSLLLKFFFFPASPTANV